MEPGWTISVAYGDEILEGVFITKDPFIIKLSSGYNLVLDPKKVGKITVLEQKKEEPKPEKKITIEHQGKHIAILHLGGTIASKIDYTTGAVIAQFSPEEILQLYPEVATSANITCKLIANVQSEMLRFPHYNIVATAIAEEVKKGTEGIIVTQGTDTMHYTSAALAFMLENLPIPVVFVGSQRSSDRPSTDGRTNLLAAITFITTTKSPGIFICMHENTNDDTCTILPGLKTRKMHTSRRDAFKPINAGPIARVYRETKKVELFQESHLPHGQLTVHPFKDTIKVGMLKAHLHMYADELLHYKDYDGLILEGLGIGHMPTEKKDEYTAENEKIYAAIKELSNKMPVAFASQCLYGRANMDMYTPGRELLQADVLGNQLDMTPETAFIKLAWLLSNYSKEEAKKLFAQNLRGEITDRTEKATFPE
jgi:glutamyl-tRNA(Gln) amidotransferase subunit D